MSDERLEPDFAQLLGPHLDRLYRLAFRLTGQVADAEDLVQQVLIKAFDRRSELTVIDALGPWLSRVLYNLFIDDRRRFARGRLKVASLDDVDDLVAAGSGPEPAHETELDIIAVTRALGQLSLEHRSVLVMHDAEGYKLTEIQTITGVPLGTLKSRLHRARARLRDILSRHGTF